MRKLRKAAARAMARLIRCGGIVTAVMLGGIGTVSALPGDLLTPSLTPFPFFDAATVPGIQPCASGIGTGVAHDGTNLILSCQGTNVLDRVTGIYVPGVSGNGFTKVSSVNAAGATSLGALDWDSGRQKLWACNNDTQVVLINMTTGAVDPAMSFTVPGCTDGLAYDASDDSLWMTDKNGTDLNWIVYHYDVKTRLSIAQFPGSGVTTPPAYPPSGIALACNKFYISGIDATEVDQGPWLKGVFADAFGLFAANPDRFAMSDLAVDNHSFPGKSALWVLDRNATGRAAGNYRRLFAVELPADCNRPPVCTSAVADPAVLSTSDHKFVKIGIKGVTDPDGDPIVITATGVSQDEVVKGDGEGSSNSDPDAKLSPLSVRAERNSGSSKKPGDGRVYHIDFTASDGKGGTCSGTVLVCVPYKGQSSSDDHSGDDHSGDDHSGDDHSKSYAFSKSGGGSSSDDDHSKSACVDGGPLYNSLKP